MDSKFTNLMFKNINELVDTTHQINLELSDLLSNSKFLKKEQIEPDDNKTNLKRRSLLRLKK